jgi:hypothetical protein
LFYFTHWSIFDLFQQSPILHIDFNYSV